MSIRKIVLQDNGNTEISIKCDVCGFINKNDITSSVSRNKNDNEISIDFSNLNLTRCNNCDTPYYFIYSK